MDWLLSSSSLTLQSLVLPYCPYDDSTDAEGTFHPDLSRLTSLATLTLNLVATGPVPLYLRRDPTLIPALPPNLVSLTLRERERGILWGPLESCFTSGLPATLRHLTFEPDLIEPSHLSRLIEGTRYERARTNFESITIECLDPDDWVQAPRPDFWGQDEDDSDDEESDDDVD
ncbi:hypothetical protein JCM11641_001729 [Rhodosporidiobolus odoratus]